MKTKKQTKLFSSYSKRILMLVLIAMTALPVLAKDITVKGVVKEPSGETVIGASVALKGTSIGTITGIDGDFILNKVPENGSLVVTCIGMKSQTIAVNGRAFIEIIMEKDSKVLDEVVVVGYGTQKKANLTGTVNTVKAEALVGKPATSLTNAMQGVTPGVTVISRPGNLGSDMGSINVRGRGNLGTSSPLYILDGVPVSEGDFQRIHPGDIESISILKDAAASSIYGSRAAFGVFLVTTKKGKEGKTSVSYDAYYGLQSPTVLPDKLGSLDYANLINEANLNAGKKAVYSQEQLDIIKSGSQPDLYPNNDWYGLVYRNTAPMQEHNVTVSGGGKTRYFVSGTYYDQESLVRGRTLDRYSFRSNTERDFTDFFRMGTNISYVKDDYNQTGGDFSITDLDRMTPLTVAKHSDGTWGSVTAGTESAVLAKDNPLRKIAEYGRSDYQTSRFNASLNANLRPIKGLEINGVLSYNKYDKNASTFVNTVDPIIGFIKKAPLGGTSVITNKLTNTWETSSTFMAQAYASYSKTVGAHDASIMAGTQYENYSYKSLMASRKNFPSNELGAINGGSGVADDLGNSGSISERGFFSQFGRINYAYSGKYLFEANVRFDQSSQFAPGHRLGIFPSFSGAWRLSEEAFMKNIDWLANLKLRASWGKLGNVGNVGYYDYFDMLKTGTSGIMGDSKVNGAWPAKQANENLSWETVTMTNVGVDAGFFNNAFDIQLDLFNKATSDILLVQPQPFEGGYANGEEVSTNAGKVSNKGIEFAANYRGKIGELQYTVSGNVSKIWNEITDLNGVDFGPEDVYIKRVGEAIGAFYGYQAEGLFVDQADIDAHVKQDPQTKPGDIKYKDVNGDKVFNADDRTILGNDVPYFTYGLSLNATYQGFDLSIQGQGVNDVQVYLSGETSQAFFNGAGAKKYHLGRWTAENPNPNAIYPRILPTANNNQNVRTSSFWLYDADYFRIKSLIFGYTLPNILTQKVGINKARIYMSGSNLFTFRADKRMKDFDPEVASSRGSYPNLKVFSLGVNVTF